MLQCLDAVDWLQEVHPACHSPALIITSGVYFWRTCRVISGKFSQLIRIKIVVVINSSTCICSFIISMVVTLYV